MYRRRRIGKSTLIKKVIFPNDVYYMADQTEHPHQIELPAKKIGLCFEGFDRVIYPDRETLSQSHNFQYYGLSKADTIFNFVEGCTDRSFSIPILFMD